TSKRIFIENSIEQMVPEPAAGATEPMAVDGRLEAEMLRVTGVTADRLAQYLAHRLPFLGEVVRADLTSLEASLAMLDPQQASAARPAAAPRAPAAPPRPPAPVVPVAAARSSASLEDLLINLVVKRTGYPKDTVTVDSRLL